MLLSISQFNTQNGLSDASIFQFYEDNRGFIWIATDYGLNRFDGKDFKHFFTEEMTESSNSVRRVVEDKNQNIWVSLGSKRGNYTGKEGFYTYLIDKHYQKHLIDKYFEGIMPFPAKEIKEIQHNISNELIILLRSGLLYRYDGDFKQIGTEKFSKNVIFSSKLDSNGSTYLIDPLGNQVLEVTINNEIIKVPNSNIFKPQSNLTKKQFNAHVSFFKKAIVDVDYFNMPDFFAHFFTSEEQFDKIFDKNPVYILETVHYNKQSFFIGHNNENLTLFNKDGTIFYDFTEHIDLKKGTGNVYMVRPGQFWFSNKSGFTIINYTNSTFTNLLKSKNINSTRSLTPISANQIIVASDTDVQLLDINTRETEEICTEISPGVWGVSQISPDEFLFGRYGPHIILFDIKEKKKAKKTLFLKGLAPPLSADYWFMNPFKDSQNNIYIGTMYGLLRYNMGEDSLNVFTKYNEFTSLKKERINCFKEDTSGIWLGTSDGLYLLDAIQGIREHYPIGKDLDIQHIHREGDIFWLASYNKGLIKWNIKTETFKKYGRNSGFLNEKLSAVYPSDSSYIWLASENGLIQFNKETEMFQTFFKSDGLTHSEFNRASHSQMPDGRILLGGMNGINTFYPNQIIEKVSKKYPLVPTSYIEFARKTGDLLDKTKNFLDNPVINLKPGINSFKIDFSLLKFNSQVPVYYQYKIKGYRDEIIQQKDNEIRINGLPYGNYNLELQAFQGDETISEKLNIPIRVLKPFYKETIWKYVALLSLIVLAYLSYLKLKVRADNRERKLEDLVQQRTLIIKKQKQDLEELNSMKNRLFTIIGHDLRNPVLSFKNISKKIDYLLDKKDYRRAIEFGRFIGNEAEYLHDLLENLLYWALIQQEDKKIFNTSISILDIVTDVKQRNLYQIKNNKLIFNIDIPKDLLVTADRLLLETVLRNLISNAFRYTPTGGRISIKAYSKEEQILIEIKDTGKGMNADQISGLFQLIEKDRKQNVEKNISLGLFICKELVELMGGSIKASSQKGSGSLFTINLMKG